MNFIRLKIHVKILGGIATKGDVVVTLDGAVQEGGKINVPSSNFVPHEAELSVRRHSLISVVGDVVVGAVKTDETNLSLVAICSSERVRFYF